MSTVRTLLISQKPELPAHVDRAFAAGGLDVELVVVDAVQTALDTLQEQEFGLLLLDLETPDAEGLDGVEQLAMTHPVPILALHEEAPVALSGPTVKAGAEALLSTASLRSGLDLPRTARAAIERHQRSLRTARSDRLAVVGRMAASVAHEINNPVAFVTLNHSAAQRSVRELAGLLHNGSEREQELLADLRHLLTENQEGLERIRTLVRDLRLFVREEERIFEELRLDALVERSIKLIRNEIRHHATLELDLPQVAPIIGEAHRIAQVVTNLLINAAQATETGTGPARIRAKLSEDPSAVMLTVEDSGRGVPQNLQDRIFD
ncbi:MAG: ATP-binding protein, partial [Myxococcota bacterium]